MEASYYREQARYALEGKWGKAILASLIAAVLGGLVVGSSFSMNLDLDEETLRYIPDAVKTYLIIALSIGSVLGIVQFILGGVIQLGYCRFLLKMEDGQEPDIKDLFSQMHMFGSAFVMNLLRGLYIALWTLLFIIPGIVACYKYAMAPFILLENPHWSANDAISQSKEIMRGNKFSLFCLNWSFIGWILLSVLTLGIGYLWLNPYMNAAYASFYRNLAAPVRMQPQEQNQNFENPEPEIRENPFPPRF